MRGVCPARDQRPAANANTQVMRRAATCTQRCILRGACPAAGLQRSAAGSKHAKPPSRAACSRLHSAQHFVRQVHGNVCMRAVVVTPQLDWRLHAFDLLCEAGGPPLGSSEPWPLAAGAWAVSSQYKAAEVCTFISGHHHALGFGVLSLAVMLAFVSDYYYGPYAGHGAYGGY